MRIKLRLVSVVVGVVVALSGVLATPAVAAVPSQDNARPAAASAVASSCGAWRSSPYYWDTQSCLIFSGGSLSGAAFARFRTGFTRTNVEKCSAYVQLVSSYGSGPTIGPLDCTAAARAGGFDPPPLEIYTDWGPGRRVGDTYRQYAWIDVRSKSGRTYLGRDSASVSPTVTKTS